MSKAERYIELVSDENGHLCDQHALKAVEIAREEMIEKMEFYIENMVIDITFSNIDGNDDYHLNKFIEDFKKAMML